MSARLLQVLAAIDAANAADPAGEALAYGAEMSAELARLVPDAPEVLQIAARGQHVERWLLPRADFPDGKEGYHAWRREQGRRHGARLAAMMAAAGYGPEDCARVGVLLRKEGLKRDAGVQALEDAACLVFLRTQFAAFAAGRDEDQLVTIVEKTARKMSAVARGRALAEIALPDVLAAAVRRAD